MTSTLYRTINIDLTKENRDFLMETFPNSQHSTKVMSYMQSESKFIVFSEPNHFLYFENCSLTTQTASNDFFRMAIQHSYRF